MSYKLHWLDWWSTSATRSYLHKPVRKSIVTFISIQSSPSGNPSISSNCCPRGTIPAHGAPTAQSSIATPNLLMRGARLFSDPGQRGEQVMLTVQAEDRNTAYEWVSQIVAEQGIQMMKIHAVKRQWLEALHSLSKDKSLHKCVFTLT